LPLVLNDFEDPEDPFLSILPDAMFSHDRGKEDLLLLHPFMRKDMDELRAVESA
jgi:hypothetical protein